MVLELLAGAAVDAVFGELLKLVIDRTEQTVEFDTLLTRLETTLKKFEPVINEITELSKVLNRPVEESTTFTSILKHGKELVVECSRIKVWDVIEKDDHASKLIQLDNELLRFFQIDAQAILVSSSLKILTAVSTATSRAVRFSGPCSVPGLPQFVIGLDRRLAELKHMLLKDETRLLVISAPGGFGKTTLAKMLCHDPGFKILVTSRSEISRFNSTTYDLGLLNAEDAKTLFCHSAFPRHGSLVNNVPHDLVNKILEFCKGIPLALTVVGASLCGRPEIIWKATLKKWSEGQSILESHQQLLLCLQTSFDALDELHKNCFLDLGLFPEDDEIAGTLLLDMWVELYKLDDEGVYSSQNLLNLKSRNLINLVPTRKAAGETEGHCSQYRVTQHDVLRDLAIHMNRQEPAAERERLFMEINSNNFPEWWNPVAQQTINARILSISTDEEFNSGWYDLNAQNIEVLILNIRSKNYSLPWFIERMSQLKVLIVTGYGVYPTQLDKLQVLGSLSKLSRIRFEHISVSSSVQVIFTLESLKKLTFVICKIGDALNCGPNGSPYMLENLQELEIDLCYDLKELPAGLCSSVHLQEVIITNCQQLNHLPEDLGNLSNLEVLRLRCCTNLKELPESIERLGKLRLIDISDCSSITTLPEQIGELSNLRVIDISGCEGLDKLPMSLTRLKQLEDVWCDEERSCLWKNIESDLCNVPINIVEEDRTGTLKKICSNLS